MRESHETPSICDTCGIAGCAGECALWLPREEAGCDTLPPPDHAEFLALRAEGFKSLRRALSHRRRTPPSPPLTDAEIERRGWFPRGGTYYEGWKP